MYSKPTSYLDKPLFLLKPSHKLSVLSSPTGLEPFVFGRTGEKRPNALSPLLSLTRADFTRAKRHQSRKALVFNEWLFDPPFTVSVYQESVIGASVCADVTDQETEL